MWWYEEEKPVLIRRKRTNRRRSKSRDSMLMVNARTAEKKQHFRRKVGTVVLVCVALAGILWVLTAGVRYTGRQLFTRNNEYAIRHLDLNSDGRLKTWHIREYAGLEEGMNLFSVDIRKIRRDLESVPLVRSVTVQRRLPDTLAVRITERVALARLGARRSGLPLAVDREGYVLGPSARSPALPAITGLPLRGLRPGSYLDDPVIRDALKVLDVCDTTRLNDYIKIERVDVHDPDFLELQLETGPRVQLARNRFDWRLRKVAGILRANRQMGRMPSLINATGDNNFPVQYN